MLLEAVIFTVLVYKESVKIVGNTLLRLFQFTLRYVTRERPKIGNNFQLNLIHDLLFLPISKIESRVS